MTAPAVQIEGATELRKQFKQLGGKTKDLSAVNRKIARSATELVKARSSLGTRQQASAAKSFIGRGTSKAAEIGIRNTASMPYGLGAFMGSIRWKQFPAWVGNSWELGSGDGPYVLRDVFGDSSKLEEISDEFLREFAELASSVGLDLDIN